MDPSATLQNALAIISLLEFSWSLATGDSSTVSLVGQPSKSAQAQARTRVSEVIDYFRSLIIDCSASSYNTSGDKVTVERPVRDCCDQATVILNLLGSQTSSIQTTEWQAFQNKWKNICENGTIAIARGSFVEHGAELRKWLIELLSDGSSLNNHLHHLQKEADGLSSVRGPEVAAIQQDILSALGHRLDKRPPATKSPAAKTASRYSRKDAKSTLQSSDSSDHESRQTWASRKKRRPRPLQRSTQESSNDDTTLQPPIWLALVKSKLIDLCEYVQVVPLELRLLKQLNYDSIDSREDSIREAESGTFSWMLDDDTAIDMLPHMHRARRSFIEWLNSGSGVFHISGNAGAGKSTLMKLLRHHQRTQFELKTWAGEQSLVFSSFYFWNSGNQLQMSLEGLYRSVLLEVCRKCPDLISTLFPSQWQMLIAANIGSTVDEGLIGPQEINDAFSMLLTTDISAKYRMCFFIDGLDEYTGENVDYRALAGTIRKWGDSDGVKLCVSARPYDEFLDTFDASLRLHLHDLTSQDIEKYAKDSFRSAHSLTALNYQQFVKTIVQKSEGVFLWARVVVRSLVSLASSGLNECQLQQRLESYPADIYELYDNLLESLGPEERLRSNQMLLLATQNPFAQALNALWFSWIDALGSPSFPSAKRPYATVEINARHSAVRLDLEHLTKGLLEMHTDRRERKDGDQFYRQRIQFFHRTARDFLRSPARSKQLKQSFGSLDLTEIATRLRLAEIVLAGKYKKNPGADPRRRRLYFNYVRALFNIRDDRGQRYQIPRRYMQSLKEDLESTTDSSKFSSPYAVSSYASIANRGTIDEDPERAASFLHLALCHGQCAYVLEELQRQSELSIPRGREELSLALSAAFGQRRASPETFEALLRFSKSPLTKVKIRPPLGNDFLATKSYSITILTNFVARLVFTCLEREDLNDLFIMLGHSLEVVAQEDLSVGEFTKSDLLVASPYLCLLHSIERNIDITTNQEVLVTTLGQLALRYAPSVADSLLPLLGENDTLWKETNSDASRTDFMMPPWVINSLKPIGLEGSIRFVTHDFLDDYFCIQDMSLSSTLHAVASTILSNLFISLPVPQPNDVLQKQVIVVTGSNTGLGLETSRHLLHLGVGKLIMAVRNQSKGEEARRELLKSTGRQANSTEVWLLDMDSYDSVKTFANRVSRLRDWTASWLTPMRESGQQTGNPCRFVVPNSVTHYFAPLEELRAENGIISRLNDPEKANMGGRYPVSRLLVVFVVRELAGRCQASPIINTPNPGYCLSQLMNENAGLVKGVADKVLARSTEMGSRALYHGLISGAESHGQYLTNCQVQSPAGHVTSDEGQRVQKAFFEELLEKLEKIHPGISRNVGTA
ncbi:hypothetical protein SCUP234_03050 [Seiridium cupressi]